MRAGIGDPPKPHPSVKIDSALAAKFEEIYKTNMWGSSESHSGTGSEVGSTAAVRECLGQWIKKYQVHTLLDIPCGDGNWQRLIPGLNDADNIQYYGFNISTSATQAAKVKNADMPNMQFGVFDLVNNIPMKGDMIIIKHLIQHLTLDQGLKVVENAKAAGIKWLAVTSDPKYNNTGCMDPGCWWPGPDAEKPPFSLGAPTEICKADAEGFRLYDLEAWRSHDNSGSRSAST